MGKVLPFIAALPPFVLAMRLFMAALCSHTVRLDGCPGTVLTHGVAGWRYCADTRCAWLGGGSVLIRGVFGCADTQCCWVVVLCLHTVWLGAGTVLKHGVRGCVQRDQHLKESKVSPYALPRILSYALPSICT